MLFLDVELSVSQLRAYRAEVTKKLCTNKLNNLLFSN